MKFSSTKFILIFTLGIFCLNACSRIEAPNQNANLAANGSDEKTGAQPVKDDVEELERIVKLNFMPEEATWREDNSAGGKKLTAILKYSAEDAANVAREAEKYKPVESSEVDTESWFPAELIAQSQLSGDESLKGATFAADDFMQPPFSKGKLTRIGETNYFVLELTAS